MIQEQNSAALKKKLVSQALKEPLFHNALTDAARDIIKESEKAPNEATIESVFERKLYAVLKDIGVDFSPIKESPISTKRHTAKGRTDSRLGALVIEFKQPSTLSSASQVAAAEQQLANYLESIANDNQTTAVGWLIDGVKFCELRHTADGTTSKSALSPITGKTLLRLTQQVVSLEQSALTSTNLIKDFCGDEGEGVVFRLARDLSKVLGYHSTLKSEMLRTEWEELFRLAHEDQSLQKRILERREVLSSIFNYEIKDASLEYQSLFCLHTSYAIILKLIAYRVVCDVKFDAVLQDFKSLATASSDVLRGFCASLEDGEIFRQIGILNLLEGDFFSWYADENQWNASLSDGISEVVQTLARYEDAKVIFSEDSAVDLFRSLYEATVPQTVRASFGEFYTPFWLAEHVVRTTDFGAGMSAIDPCCGSGTFVIAAIGSLRKSDKNITAKSILQSVAGVDLNPLAVLTARIHYFIHIADLIEKEDLDEFVIPVFLGDASNVPTILNEDGVDFFYYELKTLKTPVTIYIPTAMCTDFTAFVRVMFEFESFVHRKEYEQAKDFLVKSAMKAAPQSITKQRVGALADQLIELERREWNGIWARIITNFIATVQIGPFDCVIGNPPWIDWKSLPSGYREKIKELCIDKGLFSGAGRTGGINLNVCALITHVAATNWLKREGKLSFLMPRELINQASYEGWRQSVGGDSFSLLELHDWSKAGHPFDPVKEDFMTFVFKKTKLKQDILPVFQHEKLDRKEKSHSWKNLSVASNKLGIVERRAGQLIDGKTIYTFGNNASELKKFEKIAGKCSYIGREGIEFYPQELMIFRFEENGPKKGTAWLRNIQVNRSKYRIPEQRVLLETKYLFPLVKGPHIKQFDYEDPELYVAFPYDKSAPHKPLNQSTLRKEAPLLLSFYNKFKKQLEQQTAYSDSIRGDGEFYGVARTGPYSFNDCYVAYRDNTKWRATVITTKECPWGEEKRYLFQNHAVSICERDDGQIIDEDEAFFVAGIFNTEIVEKFIIASSDNRSFKIRAPISVPLFDKKNETHKEISILSRKAQTDLNTDKSRIINKIEKLYLSLV